MWDKTHKRILNLLEQSGPLTIRQIARRLKLNESGLEMMLVRLESEGEIISFKDKNGKEFWHKSNPTTITLGQKEVNALLKLKYRLEEWDRMMEAMRQLDIYYCGKEMDSLIMESIHHFNVIWEKIKENHKS